MSKAMSHQTVQSVEHAATITSYGASGAAVFLGLNASEWGIATAVVGIIGAVATFAFNAWFRMKYHRD